MPREEPIYDGEEDIMDFLNRLANKVRRYRDVEDVFLPGDEELFGHVVRFGRDFKRVQHDHHITASLRIPLPPDN